jgi:DnaJ-class molecular chaperone
MNKHVGLRRTKIGDEVPCVICDGRGYVAQRYAAGGNTGKAVICGSCEGGGTQVVAEEDHVVAFPDS